MIGLPSQTIEDVEDTINKIIRKNPTHISVYSLIVEPGTIIESMINSGKYKLPDEDVERKMYWLVKHVLEQNGYIQYEISNFAKPGYRSHHNSSYWQDVPYIGLGAAAHSYDLKYRSYNVADIQQYIEAIEHGELPSEQEVINEDTHYNDRITTALRTIDGLDLTTLSDKHRDYCMQEARRFLSDGLLRQDDQHLILTRKGLFVSDMVMSSLMLV